MINGPATADACTPFSAGCRWWERGRDGSLVSRHVLFKQVIVSLAANPAVLVEHASALMY